MKIFNLLKISLAIFSICFIQRSYAQIYQVNLYPQGSKIFASFNATQSPLILYLPLSINPSSISFKNTGLLKVQTFSIKKAERPPAIIAQFMPRLKNLKKQRAQLTLQRQTQKKLSIFWENQIKRNNIPIQELSNLNTLFAKKYFEIKSKLLTVEQQIKNLDQQIKKIEQKINQLSITSSKTYQLTIYFSGRGKLNLTYFDQAAGWSPQYDLYAFPAQGKLILKTKAHIWQKTATNWKKITLNLVSGNFSPTIYPPPLPPWIIGPHPDKVIFSRTKSLQALDKRRNDESSKNFSFAAKNIGNYFDTFTIKPFTLKAGNKKYVNLDQKTYPARYTYLIRPYLSNKAFLSAQIDLKAETKLPQGQANLFLNDNLIGKINLANWQPKLTIFLGNDPQVKVKVYFHKEEGENGLFSTHKDLTYLYKLLVQNFKRIPIVCRIEDSKPEIREKNVKIKAKYSLSPQEKENKLIWTIKLAPQEKKELWYSYEISYPAKLKINIGR